MKLRIALTALAAGLVCAPPQAPVPQIDRKAFQYTGSKVDRAGQELKGFERIAIQPNQTKTVKLTVKAGDLAYRDEKQNKWAVEEDQVKFAAGPSSAAAKLEKTIHVVQ